ncbi:hypothetical protein BD414DRAFT_415419 [Trametes punicea]|nr:hypothetical protein BD414DRAFT_415419 [Trametes punicea]
MGAKNGQPQAARYAFKIQQARPDRPGLYVLSVKPKHFQVVFSSPAGIRVSDYTLWTNLDALCSYVYSLYDPPANHILYDHTLAWTEPPDHDLGPAKWTITTASGRYNNAEIAFLGDPWSRRTTVFRVKQDPSRTLVIKESYVDCRRRYQEMALLTHIHEEGYVPGVVRAISSEIVKNGEQEISSAFKKDDVLVTRTKHRIVLADVGLDLNYAENVNDLLMTVYDALEVHRTVTRKRRVLHRDMSIYNLLMYPSLGSSIEKLMEDFPPLIDDVLDRKLRPPNERRARCLVIDYDNSAMLANTPVDSMQQAELRTRTGTPAYIARAVCSGFVLCAGTALAWRRQMPLLRGEAKDLYTMAHGEDRYNAYNDAANTIHGGIPPQDFDDFEMMMKALAMPFYHRWEYDAESVFWTMYSALLRVTPKQFVEDKHTHDGLNKDWSVLRDHAIPEVSDGNDTRMLLLDRPPHGFMRAFPPVMAPVARLLFDISRHVLPSYALMEKPPIHDDHLHEAMQRLILQYLVDNRDNPIPLEPATLRKIVVKDRPAVNRGTSGLSLADSSGSRASKKRSRDPTESQPPLRSLRPSQRRGQSAVNDENSAPSFEFKNLEEE